MKHSMENSSRCGAFTMIELLIVIAVIAIIISLLQPALIRPKATGIRIKCYSNLKQVSLAFRLFAMDHAGKFPMEISTSEGGSLEFVGTGSVYEHFRVLSNELNIPKILICPADKERVEATDFHIGFQSNTNTSYFIGINATDTTPRMFLAGDRNILLNKQLLAGVQNLQRDTPLSWSKEIHKEEGNVAFADGSVQGFSSAELRDALLSTGTETNLVSIPN